MKCHLGLRGSEWRGLPSMQRPHLRPTEKVTSSGEQSLTVLAGLGIPFGPTVCSAIAACIHLLFVCVRLTLQAGLCPSTQPWPGTEHPLCM